MNFLVRRGLCSKNLNEGGSGSSKGDLLEGLKGLFSLPPNFRMYQRFISYGFGGFGVVVAIAYSGKFVHEKMWPPATSDLEERR